MPDLSEREQAVERALTAAKEALARVGAQAVKRDRRQLEAFVRRVNEDAPCGLRASHLVGAPTGEVVERVAICLVLARVAADRFAAAAARRAGSPEIAGPLEALSPSERGRALMERHALDWADLHEIALDAGSLHPGDTLSEAEHEAASQLVPVGLTAVRGDRDLAAELSAELGRRARVRVSADEIHAGPPGRLLPLVRERASELPAASAEAGAAARPRAAADEGIVVQWAMSPQCVLRIFLKNALGVLPPSKPGELYELEDGHRLVLEPVSGDAPRILDPRQTDKILHRDDVVRLVEEELPFG